MPVSARPVLRLRGCQRPQHDPLCSSVTPAREPAWSRTWTARRTGQRLAPDVGQRDAQVRAEALREAADEMSARLDTFPAKGAQTRARWAETWLRDRADREAGEGS